MVTDSFITDKDIEYFNNNNINYNTDMPIFLEELRLYFNEVWDNSYTIENKIYNIDELNYKYLNKYPSWGGYYILEDSFTVGPTEILSNKSKFILGFLYNIHLH